MTHRLIVSIAEAFIAALEAGAGGVVADRPQAVARLAADIESGRAVRVEGVGCHKCNANIVIQQEHDAELGEGAGAVFRQTVEHDPWCAFLRERDYRHHQRTGQNRRKQGRR